MNIIGLFILYILFDAIRKMKNSSLFNATFFGSFLPKVHYWYLPITLQVS
jgi:hypothetical protein